MRISIDWIREFAAIPQLPERELATRITMSTCEIEEISTSAEVLNSVFVARITGVKPHPNADTLHLVTFDAGRNGGGEVVCGAPNVKPGIKVPFAPVGTTLPAGFTLTAKEIRGVVSEGMLCSEVELDLGEDASGLMVLSDEAEIGATLSEALGITSDMVLDVDNKSITHRPDLWGHYGMARDFAAVFDVPLENPYGEAWAAGIREKFTDDPSPIVPRVEKDTACKVYYGITVRGVKVEDSPSWMQARLIACGLRPINSIVDISNYVMLELGMPNHIFDLNLIGGGKIIIRRTGREETFVTLDEMERQLIPEDTVVADAEKPLVIGGIMGGLESGVTEKTTDIFIEVANWVDVEIRKTTTRLGLRTDSSQRYEKSQDNLACERTAFRLADLVLQLNPGAKVVGKLEYDGEDPAAFTPKEVDVRMDLVNTVLGVPVPTDEAVRILESLEFGVEAKTPKNRLDADPKHGGEELTVTVPSFRATKDIDGEADIIEEIGRIYGYDKVVPTPPKAALETVLLSPPLVMRRKIRDFLAQRGRSLEIINYPLIGRDLLEQAEWDNMADDLRLENALSPERDRMRPSMVPGIIESAALNQRNFESFRLFEIGRSYHGRDVLDGIADPGEWKDEYSCETNQVTVVFYDRNRSPFMDLANCFEDLMNYLNLSYRFHPGAERLPLVPKGWSGIHPNERIAVEVLGKARGAMFTLHPLIARKFKIKGYAVIAVMDLAGFEQIVPKDKTKYRPLPKYPASEFDCTVVTEARTPVARILDVFRKMKIPQMVSYGVVDLFALSESQKTVTMRVVFADESKTLNADEVSAAQDAVIEQLDKAGFPLKQG
jgi:phenylalanyl-tRNA synthetase beta chain